MRLEYPVWNNWKAEMTPLDELSEDYKKKQIHYHKKRIEESNYLLTLLLWNDIAKPN